MIIDDLKNKIKYNCIEDAIVLIEEIGNKRIEEAVDFLIELLNTTTNNFLINASALALSDIGDNKAVEPLISLLRHPKTLGNRGTILYALEAFDCAEYSELIVELLFSDNFEVSRQSFILLESISNKICVDKKKLLVGKIQKRIKNIKPQIDFLKESIELLNS